MSAKLCSGSGIRICHILERRTNKFNQKTHTKSNYTFLCHIWYINLSPSIIISLIYEYFLRNSTATRRRPSLIPDEHTVKKSSKNPYFSHFAKRWGRGKCQMVYPCIKGIVSRDWAELEMISMDRSEVFSIAGSYFYSFLTTFSCLNL